VGRNPATRLAAPADFILNRQEHVAIVGPNGGGKSLFVDLLTGRMPLREGQLTLHFPPVEGRSATAAYGNILLMKFEDAVGTVENPYYYQQRFNSQDRDESPLLRSTLPASALESPMLDDFNIRSLLDKRMVLLSSGEMRRYQLFKHLLDTPALLIIDNPFIGLDAPMREQLHQFFRRLVQDGRVQLILQLSRQEEVPDYLTHVVEVADLKVGPKQTRAQYVEALRTRDFLWRLTEADREALLALPQTSVADLSRDGRPTDEVVAIRNLSLTLDGGRVLYDGLNWTVRRGEKWALQGRNGSGKSTLLSLICADHPAAYACDISLFGRRRGTGESIWDIKKHIGFVSPEFHRAYHENFPAIEIVASGLHDSVGLYKRPRPDQMGICEFWMRLFGIEHLRDRLFLTLSSGEQRLCLLARAFVKDPALLILDEPFHGLDTARRHLVTDIIETFCRRADKTLILVTHYEDNMPTGVPYRLQL
jgi:molybdate transport system ATP-binding protein